MALHSFHHIASLKQQFRHLVPLKRDGTINANAIRQGSLQNHHWLFRCCPWWAIPQFRFRGRFRGRRKGGRIFKIHVALATHAGQVECLSLDGRQFVHGDRHGSVRVAFAKATNGGLVATRQCAFLTAERTSITAKKVGYHQRILMIGSALRPKVNPPSWLGTRLVPKRNVDLEWSESKTSLESRINMPLNVVAGMNRIRIPLLKKFHGRHHAFSQLERRSRTRPEQLR
jgi:hypothetical protein